MTTYAIGDVQGCYDELQQLLELIEFQPQKDTLWFVGDLVNRGPKSLATLRFIKSMDKSAIVVLGNHDLHCLTMFAGVKTGRNKDTLDEIIAAPDGDELCHWLRQQPLFYRDENLNFAMSHAGIYPLWDLNDAQQYSDEVSSVLQSDDWRELFAHIYGNEPNRWREGLQGWSRLRFIINAFTRMRFCDNHGHLDLVQKGGLEARSESLIPWFNVPIRKTINYQIVFGHWASLEGETHTKNVYALDTGCVWGAKLTAMRLQDKKYFSVPSHVHAAD